MNPITVKRMICFDGDGSMKAYADIEYHALLIKGLRVIEGKHGLFISMPRQQGKDAKWYEAISPTTKESKEQISEVVLQAYLLQQQENPHAAP